MSATPIEILSRPFAIEPITNIMLPDGIFDNAIYNLQIAAHFTNMSGTAINNVNLYLESIGDPGIIPVAQTYFFDIIPADASVLVRWDANFKFATPGKRLVSFVAEAEGFTLVRSIQQIFVSETRFDSATNSYTCTVEEGTLNVSNIKGHLPAKAWGKGWGGKNCQCPPLVGPTMPTGPTVPTGLTMVWTPNPSYLGVHGDVPFADPWWKVLAVIVAIIAAVVAIVAAAAGSGAAKFSVGGSVEETNPSVNCCSLKGASGGMPEYTVAGVASAIASGAIAVACADFADPFFRGQEATPPASGEITVGEQVVANWILAEAPNAGIPYSTKISWTYQRFTTGATYSHSVTETQVNIHVGGNAEIDTPATVKFLDDHGLMWVRAKFYKTSSVLFKGTDLYSFVLFQAPGGLFFVQPLTDDGLGFDPAANDGIYAGSLNLNQAYRLLLDKNEDVYGVWRVFVFAQNVNLTKPGTPPQIAAQHIGGFFVASAITITFDPTLPCPLKAQANITVV